MLKTEEFTNRLEALKRYEDLSRKGATSLRFFGIRDVWEVAYEEEESCGVH